MGATTAPLAATFVGGKRDASLGGVMDTLERGPFVLGMQMEM